MKDSATKDKIQWIYINRLVLCVTTFVVSLVLIIQLHQITIKNVYTDPTVDYNIIGQMSEKDTKNAMALTESDNDYLYK